VDDPGQASSDGEPNLARFSSAGEILRLLPVGAIP